MKNVFLAVFASLVAVNAAQSGPIFQSIYHYVYKPLATPQAYLDLEPTGINNSDQVVGTAYIPGLGYGEAFVNSAGTTQLYPFPSAYGDSIGFGINDAGTIVGSGVLATADHAFYAPLGHTPIDLDTNPQRSSAGKAIAANGYFVGQAGNQPVFGSVVAHWIMPVGQILGNDFYMEGINDNSVMVGYGHLGGAIWDLGAGTVTQLSTVLGTNNNKATVINQAGVVAGTVGTRGFIYSHGTVSYFGSNIADVDGINSANKIVGALTNGHGFVYTPSTQTLTDINTMVPASISNVWTIRRGAGINDRDSICGLATRPAKGSDSSKGWEGTVYQGFTLIITKDTLVAKTNP